MQALNQIARNLMLGTERKPLALPSFDGELGRIIGAVDRSEPETAALKTAGVLALYELAGRSPGAARTGGVQPAPQETREVCSERGGELLKRVLGGSPELLPGLLRLAGERQWLVPPVMLPRLLDAGARSTALREAIARVAGQRGAWLARQNITWRYLLAEAGETDDELDQAMWETGTKQERVGYLKQVRARDASGAQTLLAEGFKDIPARERADLLEVLEIGLGMDDEPFLESCLDDRSKEVRAVAARLLVRLPDSAFCGRMIARITPWVQVEKKLLGRKMVVEPPEAYDKEWKRDGIVEKPPKDVKLGTRAWSLMSVVASTPLGWWGPQFGLGPAELIELAEKTEWTDALMLGWMQATQAQRDSNWAWDICRSKGFEKWLSWNTHEITNCLSHSQREQYVMELMQPQNEMELYKAFAMHFDGNGQSAEWSVEFSRYVMKKLRLINEYDRQNKSSWQLEHTMKTAAHALHPSTLDEASKGWPEVGSDQFVMQTPVHEFLAIIELRKEIQEVFKP